MSLKRRKHARQSERPKATGAVVSNVPTEQVALGADAAAAPRMSTSATLLILLVTLVLTIAAYANTIGGDFVYDDHRQILQNPLIQEPRLFGKALVSDVWAFSGRADTETGNASNYWRPLFVAALALQYAIFGPVPGPWHAVTIALHFLACAMAFFLLRRLGARPGVCAATTWIFAATPLHVESVAWISGSPDPLAMILLCATFLAWDTARRQPGWLWHATALFAFAAALLVKEIAIVFPAIVLAHEMLTGASGRRRLRAATLAALPFVAVALVYLIVRIGAIGMQHVTVPDAVGFDAVAWTAPSLAWFYVQHALLPIGLGPSYPLAPITASTMTFANLGVPVLLLALAGVALWLACRIDATCRALLPWLVIPLLPVFDVRSFVPEDIAHDRYLYISSFAAIATVLSVLGQLLRRAASVDARRLDIGTAAVGVVVAIAMLPSTRSYAQAWGSDIALWERGIQTNPERAFPHAQLGEAYRWQRRLAEARRELERALQRNPALTSAHLALAAVARDQGRYTEAEAIAKPVFAQYPGLTSAIDVLGMSYQAQGKLPEAIAVYEHGRRVAPYLHGMYTLNLAVLAHLSGRDDRARAELESLGPDLGGTRDPKVMAAWWYLGELDRAAGRKAAALANYDRYLAATATTLAPEVVALRQTVEQQRAALIAQ